MPALNGLVVEAGWNQVEADWRLMLAHGIGFGLRPPDAPVAASAIALPFGNIGWISMVLVTRSWRRRGAARWLLRQCIDALVERGCTAMLDATPDGQPLYASLGFVAGPEFRRWRRPDSNLSPPPAVTPITQSQLTHIATLDRTAFGADRAPILAHLNQRYRQAALMIPDGAGISGYAFARDGRQATQLGPLVARTPATAALLLQAQCAAVPGSLIIDAFDDPGFTPALRALNFTPQRHFTRMALGTTPSRARTIFAATGPELG